ncbi:hypothetical protein Scep_005043 [Stephania cephalantha]|uniref:Uncharacterized protein n=1 Tax=Stephania cephalantha TaxID=152367 RepID=A0AAP0PXU1_9MAGN
MNVTPSSECQALIMASLILFFKMVRGEAIRARILWLHACGMAPLAGSGIHKTSFSSTLRVQSASLWAQLASRAETPFFPSSYVMYQQTTEGNKPRMEICLKENQGEARMQDHRQETR